MPIDEQRVLSAYQDHVSICLDRREKFGELALLNMIAALKLLPEDKQELIGTLMRQSILKILVHQNAADNVQRSLAAVSVESWTHTFCGKIHAFLSGIPHEPLPFPVITPESMLPSFGEEIRALLENIDEDSPTQCFLISEVLSMRTKGEATPEAREWYAKGMKAARKDGRMIFE
jgi:hypothetical protein